ncbi:MAG: PilN domain-containing protein [Syntrophobacter sp.]
MLKGIMRYRPRNLCAIYAETRCVEVLRASRRWRSWVIEPTERFQVPEGDSVLDYLQYLNIKPRGKGSALLLFLPSSFYSVHREHYPPSLKDQLEEAINFDWQENIFHEYESTLHFFGPALPINHHISVPIFSLQREIYDKFHQALNAPLFQLFTVMPSALAYEAFLPAPSSGAPETPLTIMARALDGSQLEVHRFYKGVFLDSMLVGKSRYSLDLFHENLRCMGNGEDEEASETQPRLNLLCTDGECTEAGGNYGREWMETGIAAGTQSIEGSFVGNWVNRLLLKDTVHTFDSEILLKPWQFPKSTWPILVAVLLFMAYSFYQFNSADRLTMTSKQLKRQVNQLEIQWKPIEELQTRISKFQEDRKTLSEFNREGYPLLELLTFLTQLTPDDTWLNYLSLRKGQFVIRGESKSAIRYLSELSKTEGLTDVKFASPVTRNPTSDMERFNVQLQIDMEKLKKSLDALPVEKTEPPAIGPAADDEAAPKPKGVVPPRAKGAVAPPADDDDDADEPSTPEHEPPDAHVDTEDDD